MKPIAALLTLATLTACGAAGAPTAPKPAPAASGVTISGEASMGVAGHAKP